MAATRSSAALDMTDRTLQADHLLAPPRPRAVSDTTAESEVERWRAGPWMVAARRCRHASEPGYSGCSRAGAAISSRLHLSGNGMEVMAKLPPSQAGMMTPVI